MNSDSVESARHDATSLYKFIDSVVMPCLRRGQFSYTQSSVMFFTYIVELAGATKSHVSALVPRLTATLLANNPTDFRRQAREIATLRLCWYRLHKFVRPALDAHTLESPYGLVDFLTQRLQRIAGFEDVRFAVVHTSDLNYFQLQSAFIRQLAEQMSMIIAGAPAFPKNLSIVGIPYSQSSSVFLNTALAHEMGHFSFQVKDVRSQFSAVLYPFLLKQPVGAFSHTDIARCISLALDWLEEIYCDLFALCLAGPAFSFAFIDLLSLSRMAPSMVCSLSHPAHSLRLREQVRLMESPSIGWWEAIKGSPNHYVGLLAEARSFADSQFSCENAATGSVEELAMLCFLELIDEPRKEIVKTFNGFDSGVDRFAIECSPIQELLAHGVVPSRLILGDHQVVPTALSIVNASYFFYLERFEDLLDRISTVQPGCLECRSSWAERLEMWAAKALEDVTTNGYTFAVPD